MPNLLQGEAGEEDITLYSLLQALDLEEDPVFFLFY